MRIAKKLISWALLISFLGAVLNFAIWFMYTRQITNTLESIQKNLKRSGVTFTYDDLIFNNFKSWHISLQIKEPSFLIQNKFEQNKFYTDAIDLEIINFTDFANFTLLGSIHNDNQHTKKGKSAYILDFNAPPQVHVKMKNDPAMLKELFFNFIWSDQKTDNIAKFVHHVTYKDQGGLIYDITDGKKQPYYLMKTGNFVSVTNLSEHLTSKLHLEFAQKDVSWFPEYKARSDLDQRIYNTSVSLGNLNCVGSIDIENGASETTKEKWQQTYGNNYTQNKDITPVFEVSNVHFKNLSALTSKFNIAVNGHYSRQMGVPFPFVDLNADIRGKREFLVYYQQLFNSLTSKLEDQLPAFAFKEATNEQISQLDHLLTSFADGKEANTDALHLHLVHNVKQEFTLNGHPAVSFITQFLKIFADNMALRYPIGNLRPNN